VTTKKILQVVAIIVFLVASITVIYYLAKANFHATGVFWNGALAGFGGSLFLSSLILTIILIATKSTLTKKRSLVFLMLILSALVTAILWFFKPGDSDVWWYGAIAGFFSCLVVVLLTVTAYIAYKLMQ
jgi:hypothetical protein